MSRFHLLVIFQVLTIFMVAIRFYEVAVMLQIFCIMITVWIKGSSQQDVEQLVRERNEILDARPHLPSYVLWTQEILRKGKVIRVPDGEDKQNPRYVYVGSTVPALSGKGETFHPEAEINEQGIREVPSRIGAKA